LKEYKSIPVTAVAKQPVTVTKPTTEVQPEAIAQPKTTIELKVSDSLAEPLKIIWLFAKERKDWVTVRDIQRKSSRP
jgi:hypothetical protein